MIWRRRRILEKPDKTYGDRPCRVGEEATAACCWWCCCCCCWAAAAAWANAAFIDEVRETWCCPPTCPPTETATLHGIPLLPPAAFPAKTRFRWCELASAAATARGYPARRAVRAAEAAAAACWLALAAVRPETPRVGESMAVVGLASKGGGVGGGGVVLGFGEINLASWQRGWEVAVFL